MVKRKKRRGKTHSGVARSDHHHLLWQRKEWEEEPLKSLRGHPYCIVEMPSDGLHKKIHTSMQRIPPPSAIGAEETLWQLQFLEKHGGITPHDPIERRLRVLYSLFDCYEQPTADAIKQQLRIVLEFKKAPD